MTEGIHRRLAAIVVADVVDYSRLMGADEARTLAALTDFRKGLFEPLVAARGVIELNEKAGNALICKKKLTIIPGATHLFEEPGTLDQVIDAAGDWFEENLQDGRS